MENELTLPLPAGRFLPHRPPMALVDRLLAVEGASCRAESQVLPGGLLVDREGRLDPVALVEMLAQTYAAMRGYDDLRHGRPVKEGFLVGVRRIRISGRVAAGERLEISVRTVGAIDGFAVAEGEVLRGEEVVAAGSLKLWIPEPGGEN